jgi:dihydroorotase
MIILVRGGIVVTSEHERAVDIRIADGVIDRVEPGISVGSGDEVFDAAGLHVFPGFIDPHVHSRDPGATEKEDFAHLTRAAAAGGITTVLVMPNAVPPVSDAATFTSRASHHEASAHVDFGLWALVLGNETPAQMAALGEAGVVAVKLFWGYAFDRRTGMLRYDVVDASDREVIPPAANGDVWSLLRAARASGVVVGVHCEDHSVVNAASTASGPAGNLAALMDSRPREAESVAVATLIELARATAARVHVLHTSSARSVDLVRRAREDGVPISAETCPHYLTLDPEEMSGGRARTKVYPPLRGSQDTDALWAGVHDGTLESLSSDHAPHAPQDRSGPYAQQPAGIAGTQTMVQVLLDATRRRGLPLSLLASRLSEGTARLYGLHPRKGVIEPGADADLTMVDMDAHWRITETDMFSKDRQSPWEGVEGRGRPMAAMVRGRVVMRDGRPVGEPMGKLARPRPG